jgi:hypothetical protein
MIITVTPSAQTISPVQPPNGPFAPFALAGLDPVTGQPNPLCCPIAGTLNTTRNQEKQLVEYFRSPNALPMDRGNVSFLKTFSVCRKFTTLDQAMIFSDLHMMLCPTSGLVIMQGVGDGGQHSLLYYPNAIVTVELTPPDGVSIIHRYTVAYGTVSLTSP